jgi:hypothetical protein
MYIYRTIAAMVLLAVSALDRPARAQEDTLAVAAERGRSDGREMAARTRVESAWIKRGTWAGVLAVPAAPAVGIPTRSPAAVAVVSLGPPLASLASARFSRVELPHGQEASLADADPAYAAAYRRSYTEEVRTRRLKRTAVGVLRGAAVSGAAAYVVFLIAYARAS